MKRCFRHPGRAALSICHRCRQYYCEECLDEGKEYYYCKNPVCQEALRQELGGGNRPKYVVCPNCRTELELSDGERSDGKAECPECNALLDINVDPPEILEFNDYVELLSTFNQGDIALIKSVLEESDIKYYVSGEHFLSIDPLIQPVRFYFKESQLEEVKALLKDFNLNIWGASANKYEK